MNDLDTRKALARKALEGTDEIPLPALRMLATGLALADGPLSRFGGALECWADQREFEEVTGELAVLRFARALRPTVADPTYPELIERLEGLDGPPWRQIADALTSYAKEPAR